MHKAITNALKEKKELQKRLAEVERFLRMYKQFSGNSDATDDVESPVKTVNESIHVDKKKSPLARLLKLTRAGPPSVVAVSKGILQDIGTPLTRGELAAELEMKKVHLPGKDKESRARYVGTILWRHPDHFEHVAGRGYWLKGVPVPENEQEKRDLRERDLI